MFFKHFIVLIIAAFVSSTLVDKCENGIPKPIHVAIEGCNQPPCHLKEGSELILSMNFTAPQGEPIEELQAKSEINFLTAENRFLLSDLNACKGLINTHCPLEENEPAVYKHIFPIGYPAAKGPAQYFTGTFKMYYNNNPTELVCFKVMFSLD